MISPVAAALFASPLYPKAINNNLTNNAIQLKSQAFNSDQGDIKVDYRLSSKDTISGRFTRAFQIDPSTNSQLLFGNGQSTAPIWSVVGDWTRSFRSNLINDARFGWNHVTLNTGSTFDTSVGAFGQTIGIPNSNPDWTGRPFGPRFWWRNADQPRQRYAHQYWQQPGDAELRQQGMAGR